MTPALAGGRRRGRPRSTGSASALEPREEILRAAAALFSSQGLGATRVSEIAASVGVSAPAIYYHFENVDAIAEQLLTYVVEESAAFATAAARVGASGGNKRPAGVRLRSLVEQHVDRLTSGPYDVWFVAGMSDVERARFPAVARQADRWRQAVARLVREGIEQGELSAVDPRLAVAVVSGLVYGALELRHRGADIDAGRVAQLAVAALRSRPE